MMRQTLKKRLLLVVMVLLCVLLVAVPVGCSPAEEDPTDNPGGGVDKDTVTGITVTSGTDVEIELGDTHQITWTVQPETVVNNGVTFTSSDASIVKVNRNTGLAEALDRGEATITLTSNQNPEVTATVDITVTNIAVDADNTFTAEINPAVYPMGEVQADPEELPVDTSVVVMLKSDTVDEVFTGKLDGKGSFIFDMSEKNVTEAGVYEVGVAFPGNESASPTAVKFHDVAVKEYLLMTDGWENGIDGKLESDSTIALKGEQDWGHVFKEFEVNLSSRRYITVKTASVDQRWSIKLVSPLITANAENELTIGEWTSSTKECTIDLASIDAFAGQTGNFDVVVKLYTIGTKADNPKVVIDSVTVHGGLNAEITAVIADNYKPVTAIGDIEKQNLVIGKDVQIKPVLTPEDATFGILNWSSSDENVVTVDGLGNLHPVNPGDAKITVATLDGDVSKTFDVNVRVAVTAVSLSKTSATIGLATTQEYDLGALLSVLPENATNKAVTYTIINGQDIAEVTAEGLVKVKAAGNVEIDVVSADNPEAKATFTLTAVEGTVVMPEGMEIETPDGGNELFYYSLTQLRVTFTNEPTDKTVVWSTETPSIVRVNATTGQVRALRNGKAIIVATSNSDPNVVAKIELTVTSSYAYAFDPSSYDYLLLNFESTKENRGGTLQAGDKVKVIASMEGKADKTAEVVAGGYNPSLVMVDLNDLNLTDIGVYSFSVEVTRDGKALEGYAYEGASLLSAGSEFLDIPQSEWTPQDANFSIENGVASISKGGTVTWGHAATRVTFNLQEYPYLMFVVDEMPTENMQFDVKLSNVGESTDEGLITGIKSEGMYLFNLSSSGNSKIKGKVGDFDVTFRLFFVGSNPNPIKFSSIRLLSGQTKAISEATDPVLPTAFELEQTQLSLNALDAQSNSAKIAAKSFTPEKVTFEGLMFESADPTIATVDASGTVVGLKAGTTTITVSCIAAPSVQQKVSVTVKEEAAVYTLKADLSTHNRLTVALIDVADGTEMTLNITGQNAIKANAQGGSVTFDIPATIGAGEKEYTFTVTGGVTGAAYATQQVFSYDLGKGAQAGDGNYAITVNGDGNNPNPELILKDGAYYNNGNGWGNVGLSIKNFDANKYTYFELEVKGTTGTAGVKVNIHAATNNTLLVENAIAQAGGARTARIDMSLFADKIGTEKEIIFRTLVIGDGEANAATLGNFSAYHVVDATRGA